MAKKKSKTKKKQLDPILKAELEQASLEILQRAAELMEQMTFAEVILSLPEFRQMIELLDEYDLHSFSPEFIAEIRMWSSAVVEAKARILREHRLAEHNTRRHTDVQMQPTLCARCNKRPAKFDGYCGRCAEELGIRPKGKIT